MSVDIKLIGWKAKGLRCPDYEISLLDEEDRPYLTALVQMPNGTGKTTTLELLRATLSGAGQGWEENKVLEYRKRGNGGTGLFQVQLLHNDNRVTIQMNFDFSAGVVRYNTTLPSGQKQGFHPPRDLGRFFQPNFVRFFVFDGELAMQLLNPDYTDAQRAIGDLFQLNTFKVLKNRVQEYWERKVEDRTATTTKGFTRRRNDVREIQKRLDFIRDQQEKDISKREKLSQQLETKEAKFKDEIARQKRLDQRLTEAEKALSQAQRRMEKVAAIVLQEMRNPHSLLPDFADQMYSLKKSLDRVKLPATTSREFFHELVEEDDCICGRPLDDATREQLLKRADRYLAGDNMSLLNAMKTDIEEAVGEDSARPHENLRTAFEDLNKAIDKEQQATNERDRIIEQGAEKDPNLQRVRNEIEELKAKVQELDDKIDRYNDPSAAVATMDTWGITVLEQRLKDAEEKLAEITETLVLKWKRDVLRKLLTDAYEEASENVSREVCHEANERIEELMPHNSIRIDTIDDSLRLRSQKQGSQGETLTIAYAFLATLFNRAEHRLPFVVDSPAGPIDLHVRDRVGRLVPHLTNQFIAFTISSERQKFVPALEQAADHDVLLLTLFRKGNPQLISRAREETQHTETEDGMLVRGRSFFNEFQLDSEEEYHAV